MKLVGMGAGDLLKNKTPIGPKPAAARERLAKFVRDERSATGISVGDKAYVWNRGDIVFIKGRFTFWLGGGLDLRVGDFTNNATFMEKLAQQIAEAAPAP